MPHGRPDQVIVDRTLRLLNQRHLELERAVFRLRRKHRSLNDLREMAVEGIIPQQGIR